VNAKRRIIQKAVATRTVRAMGCMGLLALLLGLAPAPTAAAQNLDFGWSRPVQATQVKGGKHRGEYLVWPIQIVNSSGRVLTPSLTVVAVTNTGRQYMPLPYMGVRPDAAGDEVYTLDQLKGQMFPMVTRRAAVVFDGVDPRAQEIRFYVRGLVRPGPQTVSSGGSYVMVTFEKVEGKWTWVSTDFLE